MSKEEDLVLMDQEIVRVQESTRTLVPGLIPLHNKLRMRYRWYYNWHLWRYAKTVHLCILSAYIVGLFSFGLLSYRAAVPTPAEAAYSRSFVVSSAGSTDYNGIYTYSGVDSNGNDYYQLDGSHYLDFAGNGGGFWELRPSLSGMSAYYSNSNQIGHGTETWTPLTGAGPPPSIAVSNTGESDTWTVSGAGCSTFNGVYTEQSFLANGRPVYINNAHPTINLFYNDWPGSTGWTLGGPPHIPPVTQYRAGSTLPGTWANLGGDDTCSIVFGGTVSDPPPTLTSGSASPTPTPSPSPSPSVSPSPSPSPSPSASPTIAISGTAKQYDESSNVSDGETVKVAVNGVLQAQTGSTSGGSWLISSVAVPASGDTITVFIDGVSDANEANAVTKYDGTGDVTGVDLFEKHLSLGSDDNQTLSDADIAKYDNSASGNENIFFEVDGSNNLTLPASGTQTDTDQKLVVKSSNIWRPVSAGGKTVTVPMLTIPTGATVTLDSNTLDLTGIGIPFSVSGTFSAGTSTVKYTGASATNVTGTTYYNLTMDQAGVTFTADGDMTISHVFSLVDHTNGAVFNASNKTITLSGSGTVMTTMAHSYLDASTSTVRYTGSGATSITSAHYYNLTVDHTGTTFEVGNTIYATNRLTINAGTLNGSNSQIILNGSNTPFVINGTFEAATSTVFYWGGTAVTIAPTTYYVLKMNDGGGAAKTFTAGGDITINSQIIVDQGKSTFDASDKTIILAGSGDPIDLINGGHFAASTSTVKYTGSGATNIKNIAYYNLTLDHAGTNFTFSASRTVTHTFTNITAPSTMTFTSGSTYTFNNVNIAGSAGNLITMQASGSTNWNFGPTTVTKVDYADISKSNSAGVAFCATHSNDSGGNVSWNISGGDSCTLTGINISGTAKQYDESSNVSDGEIVRVAINGVLQPNVGLTTGGVWNIHGVAEPSSGDVITVFVDGVSDSSEANAVTKYDGTGDITGVNLYERHLSLGSDDNQTISNADISKYDNSVSGNEDIFFEVNATSKDLTLPEANTQTTSDQKLIVKAANTWQPSASSAPTSTVPTLYIPTSATVNLADSTLILTGSGNPLSTVGTLTVGTSTIKFQGSAATNVNSLIYNNLVIDHSATTFSAAGNIIASGTLTTTVGSKLYMAGHNLTALTNVNNGILKLQGVESINITNKDVTHGTVEYNGGVPNTWLRYGNEYNNLTFSGIYDRLDHDLVVHGLFSISLGTIDTYAGKNYAISVGSFNQTGGYNKFYNSNIICYGDFSFTGGTQYGGKDGSSVTMVGSGLQTIRSGSFVFNRLTIVNSSSDGVQFADNSRASLFTDITPSSKLTFNSGSTYDFANINLYGTSGHNLSLRSSSAGSQWFFNVSGANPTVSYTDIKDSNASGGNVINASDGTSVDSSNNSNWNFGVIATPSVLPSQSSLRSVASPTAVPQCTLGQVSQVFINPGTLTMSSGETQEIGVIFEDSEGNIVDPATLAGYKMTPDFSGSYWSANGGGALASASDPLKIQITAGDAGQYDNNIIFSACNGQLQASVSTTVGSGGIISSVKNVIQNISGAISNAMPTFIKSANASPAASAVASSVATLAAVASITVPAAVAGANVLPLLLDLLRWPIIIMSRFKRRPKWGIVYDAVSKEPVSGAKIQIFDNNNKLQESIYSNRDGSFGFLADAGSYKIIVSKYGFSFPSNIVPGKIDNQYQSVYHGEVLELNRNITDLNQSIPIEVSIPLDQNYLTPEKRARIASWLAVKGAVEFARFPILIIGTILTVDVLVIKHRWFDYLLTAIYILLWIYEIKEGIRPKMFGQVKDEKGNPVNLPIVRAFDQTGRIRGTVIGRKDGKFTISLEAGEYNFEISRLGYKTQMVNKTKIKDLGDLGKIRFVLEKVNKKRN